jgi:hypothetical protein
VPGLAIAGIASRSSFVQCARTSERKCDRVIFLTTQDQGGNVRATYSGIIEFPGALHKEISFCFSIVRIFFTGSKEDNGARQNSEDEIKGLHKVEFVPKIT